jgi:radical SAM superfamily enzyme YgiQ (UPF0313 family)
MKVSLATLHAGRRFTPLSLLYLKAYLIQQHGPAFHDVAIVEFHTDTPLDEIVARVLETAPDVLGVSCYVWNIKTMMAATRAIKAQRPALKIVLGGPEVGPLAETVLAREPHVDAVVVSEGEIPFAALVERWSGGRAIDDVKGIWYRQGDAILATEAAPILSDLNHLASPHLMHLMDHTDRVVCIETQRGCVFRCNFCFYNKDLSIRNRRFDLDRVKEEILFWIDQNVHELYLMDPIFNLNAERAKEICRFIAAHNRRRIPVHAEVWAEFIDEEMARLMRDAGFHFLEVGLQSTDETTLMTVDRRLKMQRFLDGIGYLKQYALDYEVQLIYGLPGETLASFRKSLNFAMALDPPNVVAFRLMILPGTELWRKAPGLNLEFDPEPPYYVRSHLSMSAADIDYGFKIADALDALRKVRALRLLGRERGVTYADIMDAWIAWQAERAVPAEHVDTAVPLFIEDFCRRRQIPAALYLGFASWELTDRNRAPAALASAAPRP